MLDGVRHVPLANKPRGKRGVERKLRVKNLHGDAISVPMRRGIHNGHAANAEDAVDPVLPLQRRADAEARSRGELVVAHLLAPPLGRRLRVGSTTAPTPVSRRRWVTGRG